MATAIILAAGRGERLRPLTDTRPKPLLEAGGRTLIEWQVDALVRAGFADLVVNHAHLGSMIESTLGDGKRYGARIRYSPESPALETAGGIAKALALLEDRPFLVVAGDIHTDFDYASLHAPLESIACDFLTHCAHWVLVDNPPWHARGDDMGIVDGRIVRGGPRLTYASIGIYHPELFREIAPGTIQKLFPWAYRFADEGRVTGELYRGPWDNVGTAAQLQALNERISR